MESTYLAPNKAGMCLVLVDNFSEQPVEVRVLCLMTRGRISHGETTNLSKPYQTSLELMSGLHSSIG